MPDTSLDQSIMTQLEKAIKSGIADIFKEISQLITATYIDVNSAPDQIDFKRLDQQILEKFTVYRTVLEQLCQTSKLKEHAAAYLKICFKQVKRFSQENNRQ